MPVSPRFDDIDLMEKVVLPITNLRHALEAQLEDRGTVDMQQFLMGLRAIQSNASALRSGLEPPSPVKESGAGVRKLPQILKNFADEVSPDARLTEGAS